MERRSRRGGEVERWIRAGQKHLRHIKAGDKLKVRSSTAVAMEPNLRNGIYGPVDPVITVVSVGFEYVASSKRQVMVLTFLDESKRVQLSRGRILWCDPSMEKACDIWNLIFLRETHVIYYGAKSKATKYTKLHEKTVTTLRAAPKP